MGIKCSVYIAASVDGFIARPDGDVDWLHRPEYSAPEAGDYGYEEFIASIDTLVMGRNSFEKVLSFSEWPYGEMPVVVLSSSGPVIPKELQDRVTVQNAAPEEVVSRLSALGRRHLYIDGGITIQRFLRMGLIDEMTITRIPILLGDGIPLFGAIGTELQLEHIATNSYENGFVQNRYRVIGDNDAQE